MKIYSLLLLATLPVIFLANTSFVLIKKKKKKATTASPKKTAVPYYYPNLKIVVDKSDYELKVYDTEGWLVTYPVVFGNKTLSDKKMEGDRNTPEGTFRITNKRDNYKWNKFVSFDYPTQESYAKFNHRKAKGEIPANAKIGGSIGIHGTWPGSDHVVDNYINWTEGCISMKNEDLNELYEMLPLYTKLVIQQ
jgi:murein L,D-transpeptidase YafK